jgi:copper chaperone CopZ
VVTAVTYQVTGMTCEHCVHAVTGELEKLDGVRAVTVELVPGGRSAVTITGEAPLPAGAVAGALDEAGDYQVAGSGLYPPAGKARVCAGHHVRSG